MAALRSTRLTYALQRMVSAAFRPFSLRQLQKLMHRALRLDELPKLFSTNASRAIPREVALQVTLVWKGNDRSLVMRLVEVQMNKKADCVPGGDNKLAVVVQSSDNAQVQCLRGPAPPLQKCNLVRTSMPATIERQSFGSIGDTSIDNPLPYNFWSGKLELLHMI